MNMKAKLRHMPLRKVSWEIFNLHVPWVGKWVFNLFNMEMNNIAIPPNANTFFRLEENMSRVMDQASLTP